MRTPTLAELPPSQTGWIEIDTDTQQLRWWQGQKVCFECEISSGKAGVGQQEGSGQTPHGWHYVRAAIGKDLPINAVFRGRRFTGEVFSTPLAKANPTRDWILTRILWLCGLERDSTAQARLILSAAISICTVHHPISQWERRLPMAVYAYAIRICCMSLSARCLAPPYGFMAAINSGRR